jgi:PAS domain-containing protein
MGMPLREYLDGLDRPVVVVDSDVVVRIANRKACDLFGKKPSAMEGFRGGRVFECAYSYLPEGCGRTVHCSGCAIRRTVTETLQYGHGVTHVPARIRERSEQGERETMLIISTALAGEAVLLRVDEIRAGKTLCAF